MNHKPAMPSSGATFFFDIRHEEQGLRLDHFLVSRSSALSRSRIQELIRKGSVRINGALSRPSYRVRTGDHISVSIPPPSPTVLEPEPVDFAIVYEDDAIVVVDKPAGLVVHPAPGHQTGTLVHGLLWHCRGLSGIGGVTRPGIVHRLDKDTSGLMVVAKTDHAHAALAGQFKSGEINKEYRAVVHGLVNAGNGRIDAPIARHSRKRKEMAVVEGRGKEAITTWQLVEIFPAGFSLLRVSIKTGRTHQIRVHFSHLGHPVAGDPVYGYGKRWWKGHPLQKEGIIASPGRQMLHAEHLGFRHPESGRFMEFEADLPNDFREMLESLRRTGSQHMEEKP
jgi:23S rRNA pseudouridine1911/1915/1917 synthase